MNNFFRTSARRLAHRQFVATVLIAVLGHWQITLPLQAANDTWNQTGAATYSWGVPGNWLSGTGFPNGIGDVANLNNNILGNIQVDLNQVITLGTLNIGDLDGTNTFTLAGGTGGYLIFDALAGMAAINKIGGAADVISAGIQFNDPFSISNAGGGLLTLSGALRSVSSNITFGGAGNTTVSGAISTAGNLVKNDGGTLTLSVANTYAGNTTINGGTLALNLAAALPARSAVTVAAGATLDYLNIANTIGSLSGAGIINNSTASAARILTIGRDDTSTTFTGQFLPTTIARMAITKIGAGTLTLAPTLASTYTGATIINGGAINLDFANTSLTSLLAATPLQITGGNFTMTGKAGLAANQLMGALTVGATGGAITLVPGDASGTMLRTGAVTADVLGGALLITAPANTTFQMGTSYAATTLNNRLVFSDGTANTYNWAVNTGANTTTTAFGAYTALPIAGGGANNTAYQLTASQTQTTADFVGRSVKLSSTSGSTQTWDLATFHATLGAGLYAAPGAILIDGTDAWNITGTTGTLRQSHGTNAADLIFQQYNTTNGVTVSAGIANSPSSFATNLVKAGPGLLTLTGTNTFTGTVFVNGGTLSFSNAGASGAGTLGLGVGTVVTIRDGGILEYTGGSATMAGATTANSHTFALQGGNGTIRVAAGATNLTLSGAFSGAGSLVKTGTGTLTLGAAATHTGSTFINEGTLVNSAADRLPTTPVTIATGATWDIAAGNDTVGTLLGGGTITAGATARTLSIGGDNVSGTFSGLFTGAAAHILTKVGSGVQTISSGTTSTWTGGTNVNAGVLRLAASNTLSTTGTMTLSLAAGPAQLELDPGVTQTLAALTFYGTGSTATSQGNVLIGSGTTLTLGGTLTVNNTSNPLGAVIGGAGTLAMTAARTFDVRDSAAVPAGSPELLVSTAISGTGGGITKAGNGTLLLTGTNTSTGTNTFQGGTTFLDYTTNNTNKLGTGALAMQGGALVLNGNATANTAQTVASTTLASGGASSITLNPGGAQQIVLNLGAFTRAAGAGTLRLNLPAGAQSATNGFTTTTANAATGILGGWATVFDGTQTGFATNLGGNLVALASLPKDDVATWLAGENVTDSTGYFNSTAADFSIGSLRFDAAGPSTVTVGPGYLLDIASGGILQTSNVTAGTSTITGGRLTSSTGPELIFTTDSASQRFDVASTITGSNALTKSGAGTLRLTGSNNSVGTVTIQSGTLEITGGSAIGDSAPVVFTNLGGSPTLSLLASQTETIGSLSGGGSNSATNVSLGASSTLTVNQTAALTYSGIYTGDSSTTLVKTGAAQHTFSGNATSSFTGALVVNGGVFRLAGSNLGMIGSTAVSVNNPGSEFQINFDNNNGPNRVPDAAAVTLNNTAGGNGLQLRVSHGSTRAETIGSITLNAGHNVVMAHHTSTSATNYQATLTIGGATPLTRNNLATALVRGRNLGNTASTDGRGRIIFTNAPGGSIGGGGGAGSTNISIFPFLVGAATETGLGNSLVMDQGAQGLRPLATTEYVTDAAGFNALTGASTDNVRFATNPGAPLTGTATAINSLVLDSASPLTITGPASAIQITSGAILSAQGVANTLGGFTGIASGAGNPYHVFVTDSAGSLAIASPLSDTVPLVKAGAGTLILAAPVNTFTDLHFNQGAVQAAAPGSLGSGNLNFFGGALQFGGVFDPSAKTTNFGTGGGIFDTNGNNIAVAGAIGGGGAGGFTKTGLGTLTLNAAANWTGSTTVSGGTLQLGVANAVTSNVIVSGGGALDIAGLSPSFTSLTLGTGSNSVTDSAPGANSVTVTGQTTLTEGTVAPVLAGSMNLVKTGAGTTATLQNQLNTFTGSTWVQNGTLAISGLANAGFNSSLGAPTGTNAEIFLGAGTTTGTLQYTGAPAASTNRPIVLAGSTGGGGIDSDAGGLLTMTGRAFAFNAGTKTLTLQGSNGTAAAPNVYAGLIEDGQGVVALTKAGSGVWDISNANTFTGAVAVNDGRLHVTGSVSNSPVSGGGATTIGNVAGTEAVLYLPGGSYNTNTFGIGNVADGFGVLVINGANVAANSTAANGGTTMASPTSGTAPYAGLFMSSGSFATQRLDVGANGAATGTAVLQMSGGTFNWTEYILGRAGLWEMTFSGVNAVRTGAAQSLSLGQALGTGAMTVSGGAVDNSGQVVAFGRTGTGGTSNTSTLNLNGGTLTTNAFTVNSANFGAAYVNFNGGTLRANIDTAAFLPTGLTGVYVNAGGAIIDSNGRDITIASNLLAPSGSGVTAIPVTANGSGYLGAPYVEITGGGGFGATASANVDLDPASPTFGQLLNVTITNPGHDYTSAPTINLVGGLSATGTTATLGAVTTAANTSGGLTKTGLGTLTLSGATLGYTGATVVNAGTLSITGSTGSAPSTTGITVAGGATLNLVNTATQSMNSLASLSLGAGAGTATLGLELGDTSNYDSLGTTGVASLANAIHLNIVGLSGFGTGAYTLLQGAATSGFDTNASYTYSLPGGYTYSDTLTDTSVVLNVGAAASNSTLYWLGGVNNQWGGFDGSFNSNWTTDLAGTTNAQAAPDPTTTAIFSTSTQTLAGTLATTLETPFAIHDLVFNSQTGTGPISAITIAPGAGGTLTIAPSASTAGINMQTGAPAAVTISAPLALGTSVGQTWTVADSGSLLTLSGIVSGGLANSTQAAPASNTTFTVKGSGAVDLTNTGNTFTGDILVDGGTLRINGLAGWGGPTVASSTSKTITLDNGGTLNVTSGTLNPSLPTLTDYKLVQIGSGGGTIDTASGATLILDDAGQLFGSGALTKTGNGTLILRNQTTLFTGTIDIAAGLLRLQTSYSSGGFGTASAGTTIHSGAALDLNDQPAADTEPLTIFGAGLTAAPAGVITNSAAGAASFAGPVTLGGHATIGAAAAGGITLSGGITGAYDLTIQNLAAGGMTLSTASVNNAGSITNSGTGAGGTTISSVIGTNVGNVIQNSATSALTLGGVANLWTGGLIIKAGQVNGGSHANTFGANSNVITLGDSSGSANVTLSTTSSQTYQQPITVASGNTGVASIIAGTTTGSVIFSGPVTLNSHDVVLGKTGTTGASQFTGGVTGTGNITIHNAATTGTITLATGAINPVGSITHTSTATGATTISADIGSNVTSLTQNSATSALTLSGTNIAYTGATTVNAGTLNLSGSAGTPLTTSAVTVAGGSTLNLVNTAGQSLTALTGLSLGTGSGTTTLGFELGSTSAYDSLQTAAVATLANTVRFNLTELAGFGNGAYTLLQGGAGSGFHSNAAYEFGAMPGGYAYSTTLSDTSVVLNVGTAASTLYWLGGLGDGKWNTFTGAFDTNWASDLAGTTNAKAIPGSASTAVFNVSNPPVAGALATTLEAPFSINDLIFNGQLGTGPISAITIGAGAGGSLTLNSAATGIDVQTGAPAVTINPAIVLGASQSWNVADAGTTLAMGGAITDGGSAFSLTKTGPGRILFGSASSTYTGGLTLNTGTVAITGSGTDGANTAVGLGTLKLNGGTFELASTTGSKIVYVPVEIGGNISFANTSTGATDTLTFNKAITLVGGTREISVLASTSGPTILSGAIGDGGSGYGITKKGPGILALTGANTFTGDVTIDAGTLRASGATNRLGAGNLILNGGTLDINDNTGRDFDRPTTVSSSSEIITQRASAGAGVTHGLGTLSIGGQTLTVSGGNVTSGTARLDFDGTTFTGAPTFTINNPTGGGVTQLTLGVLDNQGNNATVTGTGNLAQSGVWDGAGDLVLHSTYTGTVSLTQANTFTGDITVKSGTLYGGSTAVTNVFGGGTITLGDSASNANPVLLTTAISSANIDNPVVLGSATSGTITMRAINSGSTTTYTGGVTGTNNLRLETTNVGGLTLSTSDFDIVGAVTNAGTGTGAVTISSNITSNVTNIIQNSSTSALNLSGSTIAFTGATTVSAGTLNVTSAAGLPTATTLTVDAGGTLNLVNGVTQSLGSLGGLSLGTGTGTATLGLELGDTSNYDSLGTAAAATALNTIRFNLTGLTGFGAGNYSLLSAASGLTSSAPAYQVGSAPGGYTYTFNNTDALIQLVVAAGATGNIYWRGDVDASWSTYNAGNTNWVDGSGTEFGSTPGSGNKVIFSNSGAPTAISTTMDSNLSIDSIEFTATPSGVTAVTIASGTPSISSLTITPATATDGIDVAASAGTITISAPVVLGGNQEWDVNATGASLLVSGEVSGTANLTKAGGGALTLSADNPSYSGVTTISAGTLNVGSGGATGSLGTGNVVNNGTLVFNRDGTFSVSNLISGTGALTKQDTGILTLDNNSNSFAGPVTITAGTLNFTSIGNVAGGPNNSALGAPTTIGEGTVSLAGTLGFTGSSNQSTDRLITLTGGGTLAASGTSGATITYNGAIAAGGNTLALTGTGTGFVAAPITQTGTAADVNVTSGDWTIASSTAHTFADDVTAANPGTILRLGGAADSFAFTSGTSNFIYSRNGATVQLLASGISSPTAGLEGILVGFDSAGAVAVFDTNGFNLNATRLDLGGYQTGLEGSITGSGTITGTTWNIFRGTVYANLAGSGTFTKSGLGTVTLYGDNSGLTGATTINHGELVLDYNPDNTNRKINNGGLLTMAGGQLTVTGNASANTAVTVNGLTLSGGSNVLDPNSGGGALTATLNLGAITRAASAGSLRVDLTDPGAIVTTTTANGAHGLLGGAGFATVKDSGTWFARNDGSNNILSLASTVKNDVSTWAPGDHITDSGSGFTGTISCTNINSLRFDAAGGSAVNLNPGAVLSIASGGILVTDQVASGSPGIFGGTLATGVTEMILTHDSSQLFEISSRINVNNGFTKTGNGTLLLSGFNTYSGATQVHAGTLQVTGNSIGDTSAVTLATARDSTLQLLADETIGQLAGGQRNTNMDLGTVNLGAHTLTINQGANTTYAGTFSGSGTVIKRGASTLTMQGNDASGLFTGTFRVDQGLVVFNGTGNPLAGVANVILNGSGSSLRLDNDQTTAVGSRIADAAFITLNSTAGTTADALGLFMRRNGGATTGTETLGRLILSSGHNTVAADGTGTDRIGQLNFTNATPLSRSNFSTLFVVGRNLGTSSGQRGSIRFASTPSGAVGGGGGAGTSTISIYPYMVGETTAGAPSGATNFGNTFVRNVNATDGLKPLDLTTEYVLDESAYNALGAGILTNNVRFTATPGATLDSDTTGINSLVLDHATGITLTGPAQSIQLTSGAMLSASAGANTLAGFTGITSANPYYVYVTNPSGSLTISSAFTSSQTLVKSGAGTLILSGNNTAVTDAYLNQGILQIADLDHIGGDTGALVFAGGTLRLGSGFTDDLSTRTLSFLIGGGTLDTNGLSPTLAGSLGSGVGGFTKSGAGNLTLNAAATYTGPTTLSNGTLTIGANNALGNGGDLTLAAGTTLALGTNSLSHGLVTTGGASPLITGTGTISASTGFFFNHTGDTTVGALLAGPGGLLKLQANVLTLAGLNTYTGPTEVRAGTLSFDSIGNVGGGASALGNPGTLEDGIIRMGLTTTATTLTYTGGGHSSDRMIGMQGTTAGLTINANGTGALVLGNVRGETPGAKTLTLGGTSGSALINSVGAVNDCAGTLAVTKSGTNTWAISAASTYTGNTLISGGGVLRAGATNAFGTTGSVTLQDTDSVLELADAVTISNALSISNTGNNKVIRLLSGATSATYSGTIAIAETTAGNFDVSADTGGTLTLSGIISGAVAGGVAKEGAGTVELTNANSYTGITNVNAGTLRVTNPSALGTTAAGTSVNSGGTLQLDGGITVTGEALSLTAGAGGNAVLNSLTGNNEWTGNLTVDTGADASNRVRLDSASGSNLLVSGNVNLSAGTQDFVIGGDGNGEISGTITGSQRLFKSSLGTGTWILSADNSATFTGRATVGNGTLQISSENNLGATPGSYVANQLTLGGGSAMGTLRTTGTLSLSANRGVTLGTNGGAFSPDAGITLTVQSKITGSGSLTKEGDGILLINDATNTYSGATNVNDGTLGGTGTVSGSGATIGSGASLSPGDPAVSGGVGTLSFASGTDLTFNNGSTWLVDVVQGSTADSLTGIDTFTASGTVKLDLAFSGTYTMWQTYTLASYSSRSGTPTWDVFSGLTDLDPDHDGIFVAGGGQYQITFGDTSFTLQAVPEPEVWLPALLILALGLFLRRRRPAGGAVGK